MINGLRKYGELNNKVISDSVYLSKKIAFNRYPNSNELIDAKILVDLDYHLLNPRSISEIDISDIIFRYKESG